MKKHIQKDYKRRLCVQRHEPQRAALKAAQNHFFFLIQNRFLALPQLSEPKKNSSKVKVRNRCVLTGRSRGVYNFFKMARTMIRSLASKGLLPGVKKASW